MPRAHWESKLGARIKAARKDKGLTQQKAADAYGCSLRWWQLLEQGRNISLDVLFKVARIVGTEAWTLIK